MLQENIKTFRKDRGLTQEKPVIRVNVVCQTVSKWEKDYLYRIRICSKQSQISWR